MLVVDAANVVGSRPTGWWRDRPGAAAKLHADLEAAIRAERLLPPVVMVLEGAARRGVADVDRGDLHVVHADHNGDDAIVALVGGAVSAGETVTVVTADRELRDRVERLGADVAGPRWLLDRLDVPRSAKEGG